MKLQSSNKFSTIFLVVLSVLVVILFFSNTKKKEQKYPDTPVYEQKSELDVIQITLNQKSFEKLEKKRFKALSQGILETSDDDYVPAMISFNGEDFRAEVRLKGDWTDHLKGDKWSFRVKLKNDMTILGMRKFSLHHPQTRGRYYIGEWLYLKAIKNANLMGLRYSFVEGAIHVKKKYGSKYESREVGFYALEETFDKRTIESNGLKESIILKFSEDNFWNEVKASIDVGSNFGNNWKDFMDYGLVSKARYPILPFSEEKIVQDTTMFKYYKFGRNLLEEVYQGERTLDKAFDIKKLAMQNAILNLFGAVHGTYIINLRFYYNPITSKLEPIAFDGNSGSKLQKYEHFMFTDHEKDSVYLKELAYAIDKVYQPEFLNQLLEQSKSDIERFGSILKDEFVNNGLLVSNLNYNQNILEKELKRLKAKYKLDDIIIESSIQGEQILIPEYKEWKNTGIQMRSTGTYFKEKEIYQMARGSKNASAFSVINGVKVSFGEQYSVSFNVKKDSPDGLFGLRIQGEYPNRLDAVFNLKDGKLKGTNIGGNFDKVKAQMSPLENGWYRCTLSGIVNAKEVKVLFGPTSDERNISSWEGAISEESSLFVVPKSVTFENASIN